MKNKTKIIVKNAQLCIDTSKKDNKEFKNLVVICQLNNGKVVELPVKLSFFNSKLKYMLECNLPNKE